MEKRSLAWEEEKGKRGYGIGDWEVGKGKKGSGEAGEGIRRERGSGKRKMGKGEQRIRVGKG